MASEQQVVQPEINVVSMDSMPTEPDLMGGAGRGKGGKGGKGSKHHGQGKGPKRHRNSRAAILGITKPVIRRLMRRGGIKRISGLIYDPVRDIIKKFVSTIVRDSIIYAEHARRSTVTTGDVVLALKRMGHTLYGFGG